MRCIYCNNPNSKVIDSRINEETNSIRRRRECLKCGKRFTTYETVELNPILVIKTDGTRQPYDINKIKSGIIKACMKRPISMAQIDDMVTEIDRQVQSTMCQEITSQEIGELVMSALKKVDEIAYIRYACVYRNFKDVTHLLHYLKLDFDEENKIMEKQMKKCPLTANDDKKTNTTKKTTTKKITTTKNKNKRQ